MSNPLTPEVPPKSPIEILTDDACWSNLEHSDLGRLAVVSGADIDLFPVNYLVHNRHVYFRTAPGSKIMELTRNPRVTFQADGSRDFHIWSVVIKGYAERVDSDTDIHESGINKLQSLSPTDKWNYVRITPSIVTGRRFVPTR